MLCLAFLQVERYRPNPIPPFALVPPVEVVAEQQRVEPLLLFFEPGVYRDVLASWPLLALRLR